MMTTQQLLFQGIKPMWSGRGDLTVVLTLHLTVKPFFTISFKSSLNANLKE